MPDRLHRFVNKDVVVPITYSSIWQDGNLVPSRLSRMVFDVAVDVAREKEADGLVVAGEQSYRGERNTGQLLATGAPSDIDVLTFAHGRNRLLNTAYQAHMLARRLQLARSVTVVAWAYHMGRVVQNLEAHNLRPSLHAVTADEVFTARHQADAADLADYLAERYGFSVDWPAIESRGLRQLADRERRTAIGQYVSKRGLAYKAISTLRDSGRHDDLTPEGYADMQPTDMPRWSRAAALLTTST